MLIESRGDSRGQWEEDLFHEKPHLVASLPIACLQLTWIGLGGLLQGPQNTSPGALSWKSFASLAPPTGTGSSSSHGFKMELVQD